MVTSKVTENAACENVFLNDHLLWKNRQTTKSLLVFLLSLNYPDQWSTTFFCHCFNYNVQYFKISSAVFSCYWPGACCCRDTQESGDSKTAPEVDEEGYTIRPSSPDCILHTHLDFGLWACMIVKGSWKEINEWAREEHTWNLLPGGVVFGSCTSVSFTCGESVM